MMDMKNGFSEEELKEMEALEVKGGKGIDLYAQSECSNYADGCGGGVDQTKCINKAAGCGHDSSGVLH